MSKDIKQWNVGISKLSAFMQFRHPPYEEDAVAEFHEIITILEEGSGESLSQFRIRPEKLKPEVVGSRPGVYWGDDAPQPIFSSNKRCDPGFFQSQEAGLASYVKILQASEPLNAEQPSGIQRASTNDQPLVLVSHSSKDVELAKALVEFLQAALLTNRIRCSSVDGYRLPAGVNTESQLRAEINSAGVLIGLITPNSLVSAYVMFELGARWGAGKFMIPLLAGTTLDMIREPLSLLNSLHADNNSQLHQLIGDVGKALGIVPQDAAKYANHLSDVRERCLAILPPSHNVGLPVAPEISEKEMRRRKLVSEKLKALGGVGRKIIRCVEDHGKINAMALSAEFGFSDMALNGFFKAALPNSLIRYENHVVSINPELESAIEFVLANEYDQES